LQRRGVALAVALCMGAFVPAAGAATAAPIRIGVIAPFSAIDGASIINGCELAVEQINAKGGILGRQVELLSEDSTSADTGTAVQKARKLIQRDKVDFVLGNVNSSMALAIGQVTVTGTDCHWNVFRVCNTTRMETNSVSSTLFSKYGKRWYFITPDYSFGHTLQKGFEASLKKYGGTETGASLCPLGTSDYSPYLIKAQASNPDVIIFLTAGQDAVNSLKQAVQFGLNKKFHIAGAQQELEVLEGLPPEARIGTWVFEWYWNQPNVPHVKEFVAAIKKKTGKVPTARHWFGFVSVWTCALVANENKTLDAVKLAKALEGFELPPEIALMPDKVFYRAGDHQLMPQLYVGHAVEKGPVPEDLFHVDQVVKGVDAALPVEQKGCNLTWPA
jgi:branched-chain amino acid transport system substrate-binding protein